MAEKMITMPLTMGGKTVNVTLPESMAQDQDALLAAYEAAAQMSVPAPTTPTPWYKDREEQLLAAQQKIRAEREAKGYTKDPAEGSPTFAANRAEIAALQAQRGRQERRKIAGDMHPLTRALTSAGMGVLQVGGNINEALGLDKVLGSPDAEGLRQQAADLAEMNQDAPWTGQLPQNTGRTAAVLLSALAGPQTGVAGLAANAGLGWASSDPGDRQFGALAGAGGYVALPATIAAVKGVARPASNLARRGYEKLVTTGGGRPGSLWADLERSLASAGGPGGRAVREAQQGMQEIIPLEANKGFSAVTENARPPAAQGNIGRYIDYWKGKLGEAYESLLNQQVPRTGQLKLTKISKETRKVPGTGGEADAPIFQGRDVADPAYGPSEQIVEGYPTRSLEQRGAEYVGDLPVARTWLDDPTPASARLSGGAEAEEAAFLADEGIAPPEPITQPRTGTFDGGTISGSLQHPRGSGVDPWDGTVTPHMMSEVEEGAVAAPRMGAPQYETVTTRTTSIEPNTTYPRLGNTQVEVPAEQAPALTRGANGTGGTAAADNAALRTTGVTGEPAATTYGPQASTPMRPITEQDLQNRALKLIEDTPVGMTSPEQDEVVRRFMDIMRPVSANPTWRNLHAARSRLRELIATTRGQRPAVAQRLKDLEVQVTADLENGLPEGPQREYLKKLDAEYRKFSDLKDTEFAQRTGDVSAEAFDPMVQGEIRKADSSAGQFRTDDEAAFARDTQREIGGVLPRGEEPTHSIASFLHNALAQPVGMGMYHPNTQAFLKGQTRPQVFLQSLGNRPTGQVLGRALKQFDPLAPTLMLKYGVTPDEPAPPWIPTEVRPEEPK